MDIDWMDETLVNIHVPRTGGGGGHDEEGEEEVVLM